MFEFAAEGAQPVAEEIRSQLLEPFIAATSAALGEMASTEVRVQAVYQRKLDRPLGDVAAVVEMQSPTLGFLALGFPTQTAAALARRILGAVAASVTEDLVRDCMGEIANVIAGQAKALLAETPYRFAFSTPRMAMDAPGDPLPQSSECLVTIFGSEHGPFAVQILLKSPFPLV